MRISGARSSSKRRVRQQEYELLALNTGGASYGYNQTLADFDTVK
jgi:hypothetical protein